MKTMNENIKNFIDSVDNQDYAGAKANFEAALAQKVSDAFENKKIEIASQMVEGRNKPDLQRDIGFWAIEKGTGHIYSGPYEKRKDAKSSTEILVRGGKRKTPNIVIKFGTIDRTGKFREL